jgi:predicted nuclease of predicted toxin-antitoxin system
MKILVDMNLSPDWVSALVANGFDATHWSTVGDPRADDSVIMDWARANNYVVFTHDLVSALC